MLRNIYVILGIVLVWRGVWYVLDWLDQIFFGGHHWWTAIAGVIGGILLLYLPDRDLKEIEKL
jgi:membrane associated rhomboid family serine protease